MLENMVKAHLVDRVGRVSQGQNIGLHIRHTVLLDGVNSGWKIDIHIAIQVPLAAAEMKLHVLTFVP